MVEYHGSAAKGSSLHQPHISAVLASSDYRLPHVSRPKCTCRTHVRNKNHTRQGALRIHRRYHCALRACQDMHKGVRGQRCNTITLYGVPSLKESLNRLRLDPTCCCLIGIRKGDGRRRPGLNYSVILRYILLGKAISITIRAHHVGSSEDPKGVVFPQNSILNASKKSKLSNDGSQQ